MSVGGTDAVLQFAQQRTCGADIGEQCFQAEFQIIAIIRA